ncbi:uncharacterized protein A4U43_C09F280 [Asparagus officinalis]|uniref:Uncharacterized protein n=1 Tax=Asparagus officinalis TaxID=4686 RepID=A0A5P1E7H1_ASPOF|nr:uncharacterized protein A4U43_C09F280 [Asparagus officinalis]
MPTAASAARKSRPRRKIAVRRKSLQRFFLRHRNGGTAFREVPDLAAAEEARRRLRRLRASGWRGRWARFLQKERVGLTGSGAGAWSILTVGPTGYRGELTRAVSNSRDGREAIRARELLVVKGEKPRQILGWKRGALLLRRVRPAVISPIRFMWLVAGFGGRYGNGVMRLARCLVGGNGMGLKQLHAVFSRFLVIVIEGEASACLLMYVDTHLGDRSAKE